MPRLPHRYAPIAYGIVQVAITMTVAAAAAVYQASGLGTRAVTTWAAASLIARLLMVPVVIIISPLLVTAITDHA